MIDANYYLQLPYHIETVFDATGEESGWVAEVREWPGCIAQGRTGDELMANLREAMLTWVQGMQELGRSIPEPEPEPEYSGQFRLRLPVGLHEALAREAERQRVSLNSYCLAALAGAVRWQASAGRFDGDGSTAIAV